MGNRHVCPVCTTEFDPSARAACSACPVGRGCHMICCPHCGHTTIDTSQSQLAGWVSTLFKDGTNVDDTMLRPIHNKRCLSQVGRGQRVCVLDLTRLPAVRRRFLHSFGVTPGATLVVRQQNPLTIFEIDHTELALERELAEAVVVGDVDYDEAVGS
ncbi:MAG TPA: FeoA family protein [Anaerolineales bacterium]